MKTKNLLMLISIIIISIIFIKIIIAIKNRPSYGIPRTPFYFIRHGQTNWNLKIFNKRGTNDEFLNATGVHQVQQAAQKLKDKNIKLIIASPYWRTRQTAAIIAQTIHKPVIIMPAFMERSKDLSETKKSLTERIARGLKQALQYPEPILVVGHGGTGKAIQKTLYLHKYYFSNAQAALFSPLQEHAEKWKEYLV